MATEQLAITKFPSFECYTNYALICFDGDEELEVRKTSGRKANMGNLCSRLPPSCATQTRTVCKWKSVTGGWIS